MDWKTAAYEANTTINKLQAQNKILIDVCRLLLRADDASNAEFGEGEDFSTILDQAVSTARKALTNL